MIASLIETIIEWVLTHPTGVLLLLCNLFVLTGAAVYIFVFRPRNKISVTRSNYQFSREDPDVIIIGSGVAGSAMATVLARDGRRVTIIERDLKEPDRIVGELLQPGGVRALTKLGLGDCIHDLDAHSIHGYVIHNMEAEKEIVVPYPKSDSQVNESLESITSGTAFHHGRFIMALREKAKQESNVTYIEGSAVKLLDEKGVVIGVQYKLKGQDEAKKVYAPLTFVMDGCFSRFRKELISGSVQVPSHFVGLLMNHCPQKLNNHAELILAKPSPILVYQISSNCTRILVDIRDSLPKNLKDYLLSSICPQLPEHIQECFRDGVMNGRVRSMPNSFLTPSPMERPGVLILGDAFNMRHPLTGGGMSVCLNDVLLWREILQTIPDLADYKSILKSLRTFHVHRKMKHSFVVNVLAQALYELFASSDEHLISMKVACLNYFQLGGECVKGPVSLLSVLNPKPYVLISHFFAVALFAVYHTFQSEPIWAIHRMLYRSAMILSAACGVLLPLVWSEIKTIIKK